VTVDGKPVGFEVAKRALRGDRQAWQVTLPEVFVNDGVHDLDRVTVRVGTDEGESRDVLVRVEHKRKPTPPRARFANLGTEDTVARSEYKVAFRIESERPLDRVEVRCGRDVYPVELKAVTREGKLYTFQGTVPVQLKQGANRLEVVAVNADGRSPEEAVIVSYTQPAVVASVDRINLMTDTGEIDERALEPRYTARGELTFDKPAPQSNVWLVGQVRWSDPAAPALDDRELQVVVRVGDCRQFPVALDRRGAGAEANTRRFRVPLVLIGPENGIKIEVPGVGQQERSRQEFKLACTAPAKSQRLHLLIVGVNVQDAAGLKKRVLDAVAADSKDRPPGDSGGEFVKGPPFEQCVLYPVLAGEVEKGMVDAELLEINREITRFEKTTRWLNDVILIYYEGDDVVVPGKNERWLKTTHNFQFPKDPPQEYAIPCHALPRLPGVQILLLNVKSPSAALAGGREWGGDPDAGFMRYADPRPNGPGKAEPALLDLLGRAVLEKGNLGDIVKHVKDALGAQQENFNVVLDRDQQGRRLH
jgi:hypothetical protein